MSLHFPMDSSYETHMHAYVIRVPSFQTAKRNRRCTALDKRRWVLRCKYERLRTCGVVDDFRVLKFRLEFKIQRTEPRGQKSEKMAPHVDRT